MSFFHRPDKIASKLYVITPVFNPQRYRSRWKLYKEFEKYVLSFGEAHLVTIECSFGERQEVLVEDQGPNHTVIYVRTKHELWLKENMINIAIQRLPSDWKYVAWIDGDVKFARPDWVGETIHKLQHHSFVQMFSQAADLSPINEVIKIHTSFAHCYKNEIPNLNSRMSSLEYYYNDDDNQGAYWHPGFAWAATREAINHVGGLIDWGILGGGDMYMAYALLGQITKKNMPNSLGKRGVEYLAEWQNRSEKYIRRNLGYVEGLLLHYWHGKKTDRGYKDRGQFLVNAQFDVEKDIKRDWQGLWQLNEENIKLRDGIRQYFKQRNEDSIDM